jgi:hypothetical protein
MNNKSRRETQMHHKSFKQTGIFIRLFVSIKF